MTPTPLEEIVKEFHEKFPNPIYADLTVAGLTSNWNAGKDIEAFLTSKLTAVYNAGIEKAREAVETLRIIPIQPDDERLTEIMESSWAIINPDLSRALDQLLLPTDKP